MFSELLQVSSGRSVKFNSVMTVSLLNLCGNFCCSETGMTGGETPTWRKLMTIRVRV